MSTVVRLVGAAILGCSLSLLAACGPTTRTVALKAAPPMPPEAVYPTLPLTVGVIFPEALSNYRSNGTRTSFRRGEAHTVTHYDIDYGDFHRRLLERVLRTAFSGVVLLPDRERIPPEVELIVEPTVRNAAYGGGADIRYTLKFTRLDGGEISTVTGGAISPEYKPEDQWIALAVRDAAAELMVLLARDEELATWRAQAKGTGAAKGPTS